MQGAGRSSDKPSRDHGHTKANKASGRFRGLHVGASPPPMVLQKLSFTALFSHGRSLTHCLCFLVIQGSPETK